MWDGGVLVACISQSTPWRSRNVWSYAHIPERCREAIDAPRQAIGGEGSLADVRAGPLMGITKACLSLLIHNRMAGANISEWHPLTRLHHQSPRSCFCSCGELHGRQHASCSICPRTCERNMCDLRIGPLDWIAPRGGFANLGPCLIRRFHAHRSTIVRAYIRYSAWTVRKPPADLLLFTLADGDQWGAPGSNPSGSLWFCRTRSDAMDPPWTPLASSGRSGSVAGVPCQPDLSSYLAPLCSREMDNRVRKLGPHRRRDWWVALWTKV